FASWRNLPSPIETPHRLLHQVRAHRKVPIGVSNTGVAEIGGKRRKLLLDFRAFAIPADQRADCKGMPQVVHARPLTIARAPQTDLAGQTPENRVNVLLY